MREILFKAKSENSGYSPETNGWVEGDLVHSIAGDTAISVPRYIDGIIKVNVTENYKCILWTRRDAT